MIICSYESSNHEKKKQKWSKAMAGRQRDEGLVLGRE